MGSNASVVKNASNPRNMHIYIIKPNQKWAWNLLRSNILGRSLGDPKLAILKQLISPRLLYGLSQPKHPKTADSIKTFQIRLFWGGPGPCPGPKNFPKFFPSAEGLLNTIFGLGDEPLCLWRSSSGSHVGCTTQQFCRKPPTSDFESKCFHMSASE